jgi:hypothetical protein
MRLPLMAVKCLSSRRVVYGWRVTTEADALATGLTDALGAGASLTTEVRQRLFAALVRLSAVAHRDGAGPPVADGAVAPEDVALTAAEMLRASAITSFELAALFGV